MPLMPYDMQSRAKKFSNCPAPCRATSGCWWWSWHTEHTHAAQSSWNAHVSQGGMARQDTVMTWPDSTSTNSCILPGMPRGSKRKHCWWRSWKEKKFFWFILQSFPRLWKVSWHLLCCMLLLTCNYQVELISTNNMHIVYFPLASYI